MADVVREGKFERKNWHIPEPIIPGVPLQQRPNREVQEPLVGAGVYEGAGSLSRAEAVFKASGGGEVDSETRMMLIEEILGSQVDKKGILRPLSNVDVGEISVALPKDRKLVKDETGKYSIAAKE